MRQDLTKLIEAVAEEYGVRAIDILGKDRHKPLPEARQMVCHIQGFRQGHSQLADSLMRDRTYVLSARKKMEDLLFLYKSVRDKYNNVLKKMGYEHQDD